MRYRLFGILLCIGFLVLLALAPAPAISGQRAPGGITRVQTSGTGAYASGTGRTGDPMTFSATVASSTMASATIGTATITKTLTAPAATVATALTATSANITGTMQAATGAITNTLTATTLQAQTLSGATATITNSMTVPNATVAQAISATSANITGTMQAATAAITGTVSALVANAGTATIANAITATSANITGTLQAQTASITGTATAGTVTASTALNSGGSITYGRATCGTADGSASYAIQATDYRICVTSLTGTYVLLLPSAATAGTGRMLYFKDESGGITASSSLNISPTAGDTIDGAGAVVTVGSTAYAKNQIYSAGGTSWFKQ